MRPVLTAMCLLFPALAVAETVKLARTENEDLIDATFPVVREAYRRIGIEAIEFNAPGERSLKLVEQGQAFGDVMHFEDISRTYTRLVRVPVPVIYFDAVAFYVGKAPVIKGWSSIEPFQLCIRRGIKAIEAATEHMHRTGVDQYKQAFAMLNVKRCDLAVLPKHSWLSLDRMEQHGVKSLEPPIQRFPLFHHVGVQNAAYVPRLTRVLQEMEKEGVIRKAEMDFDLKIKAARGE